MFLFQFKLTVNLAGFVQDLDMDNTVFREYHNSISWLKFQFLIKLIDYWLNLLIIGWIDLCKACALEDTRHISKFCTSCIFCIFLINFCKARCRINNANINRRWISNNIKYPPLQSSCTWRCRTGSPQCSCWRDSQCRSPQSSKDRRWSNLWQKKDNKKSYQFSPQ